MGDDQDQWTTRPPADTGWTTRPPKQPPGVLSRLGHAFAGMAQPAIDAIRAAAQHPTTGDPAADILGRGLGGMVDGAVKGGYDAFMGPTQSLLPGLKQVYPESSTGRPMEPGQQRRALINTGLLAATPFLPGGFIGRMVAGGVAGANNSDDPLAGAVAGMATGEVSHQGMRKMGVAAPVPTSTPTLDNIAAAKRSRISLSAGDATQSPFLQGAESFMGRTPTGSGVMKMHALQNLLEGHQALTNVAEGVAGGPVPEVGALGTTARNTIAPKVLAQEFGPGTGTVAKLVQTRNDAIAGANPTGIGPDQLTKTIELVSKWRKMITGDDGVIDPELQAKYGPAIAEADNIVRQASGKRNANGLPTKLTPNGLSAFEKRMATNAKFQPTGDQPNMSTAEFQQLAGAVSSDMDQIAEKAGPAANRAHMELNDLVKSWSDPQYRGGVTLPETPTQPSRVTGPGLAFRGAGRDFWGSVRDAENPEAAYRLITGSEGNKPGMLHNPAKVEAIREVMGDDHKPFVARELLNQGNAAPSVQGGERPAFSAQGFETNVNQPGNTPAVQDAKGISGGTLNDLVKTLGNARRADKMAAASPSNLLWMASMADGAAGMTDAVHGDFLPAAEKSALLAAPYLGAKLATSPRVVGLLGDLSRHKPLRGWGNGGLLSDYFKEQP